MCLCFHVCRYAYQLSVCASQALGLETSCPANTNTMEHSACARDPNLGSKILPESALPTESSLQPQVVNPILCTRREGGETVRAKNMHMGA